MIAVDENALKCDLAETYGIYDYESLPVKTVATLSAGLRDNTRIQEKMRGAKMPGDASFLLAMIMDRVTDILVFLGAYEEGKRPASALDMLLGELPKKEEKKGIQTFDSPDSFDEARRRYMR